MGDEVHGSSVLLALIERLPDGDPAVREQLIRCSMGRLMRLAHKLLKAYPGVRRWEDTDDLFQNAMMRLNRSLSKITPTDVRQYVGLASLEMRRELIDLSRRYAGRQGWGANHASKPDHEPVDPSAQDPARIAEWTEFHGVVDKLDPSHREVFDLLYYQGLSLAEAAALLEISERTIKRRWREAKLALNTLLGSS